MKILLVSQMYPGPDDPDLGVFVAQLERALRERGHEVERAVLDSRAGGKRPGQRDPLRLTTGESGDPAAAVPR